MSLRVGFGYDLHHTGEGKNIRLGGILIPSPMTLIGHSDSDVLLHAIIDAFLGAAAQGDIGTWFPSSDEKYKGIDSRFFCNELIEKLWNKIRPINIDATIITELPRLEPYKLQIRDSVAQIFQMDSTRVNIKAKTNEKTGSLGRGEAIAVHAVCFIELKQELL